MKSNLNSFFIPPGALIQEELQALSAGLVANLGSIILSKLKLPSRFTTIVNNSDLISVGLLVNCIVLLSQSSSRIELLRISNSIQVCVDESCFIDHQ
ncbi:hypothetical protein K1719_014940 [Acacia pycnantha]|nr:hypothetical protein K1719_014940 [Acacia pycnantha]